MSTDTSTVPRLKQKYQDEVAKALKEQLDLGNVMQVPRLEKIVIHLRHFFRRFTNTATIVICVLFVMSVQTVNVWVWSLTFYFAGVFQSLEPSLYFTLVSFSTLGFGDIILDEKWRILSGLTAANGLLSFGWSTAYMVELVRRTQ